MSKGTSFAFKSTIPMNIHILTHFIFSRLSNSCRLSARPVQNGRLPFGTPVFEEGGLPRSGVASAAVLTPSALITLFGPPLSPMTGVSSRDCSSVFIPLLLFPQDHRLKREEYFRQSLLSCIEEAFNNLSQKSDNDQPKGFRLYLNKIG